MDSDFDREQATRLGRRRQAEAPRRSADGGGVAYIGPYRILGRLGRGGQGEIYRAEDPRLGRVVALKLLAPELTGRDDAKSRFLREASAAAKLDHPHICTIHEIAESDDGRLYIVMACYEGESLKERLERGPLTVDETIRVARQVASGLAKAHREGIVHRDVTPANIFLTGDGVRILDFGVAKVRGDAALTAADGIVGTPRYMAPEQILGEPDHRSDLWALGAVVYEMLTGKPPFAGPQAFRSVFSQKPPRLADERPDAPDFLGRLVARALVKDPDRRYQSAEEMMAELPLTIDGSTVWTGTGRLPLLGSRRRRLAAWVAGLLVAVLAAGTFWLWKEPAGGLFRREAPVANADAPAAVAILPFTVRGAGAYDYLREGMVDLLSTQLDGAGAVRSVDPRALLRRIAERPVDVRDPAASADFARRLGADLLILGNVVEVADQLRLDAALYDAEDVREMATASAEGAAVDLFSLVDRLAIELLTEMDRGSAGRMRRLAAMTSESFPALKHYLEGESAWRAGRVDAAARAFEEATAEDPEFALAWYRLSLARRWLLDVGAAAVALEKAMEHADRLSVDDRRVLQISKAFERGDLEAAERVARDVLSRRPDDVEAWTMLGETQFHLGPLYGRSFRFSRRSWEHVEELEPDDRQAHLHLGRIDLYEGAWADLTRRAEWLVETLAGTDRTSDPLFFLAMTPEGGDERRRLREMLLSSELGPPWLTAGFTLASSREAMDFWASLYQELLEPGRSVRDRTFGHRHLGILALAGGRLEEADRHFKAAVHPLEQDQEYRALAATVPFLPVPEERLRRLVAAVETWSTEPAAELSVFEPQARVPAHHRSYVLALLVARAGDTERAEALAGELAALGEIEGAPGLVRDLELGVRADLAWRAGRHQEVVDLLAERHGRFTAEMTMMSPLYTQARERYLKADSLVRLGRDEEAAAWYETLGELNVFDLAYLAISHLRRAEIQERLGRSTRAAAHYRQFLEQWHDCDPALRPLVEAAAADRNEIEGAARD